MKSVYAAEPLELSRLNFSLDQVALHSKAVLESLHSPEAIPCHRQWEQLIHSGS